jgi:hypothetical protein
VKNQMVVSTLLGDHSHRTTGNVSRNMSWFALLADKGMNHCPTLQASESAPSEYTIFEEG